MSGGKILDKISIDLWDRQHRDTLTVTVDVHDNSLSRRWLQALNVLLRDQYHLEKNYCFLGFADHTRNGWFLVQEINRSIKAINDAGLGYDIHDRFDMGELVIDQQQPDGQPRRHIEHHRLNCLHRYFEDLQGVSGALSPYYHAANTETRWHIRQLNLLCHEFESWALSYRKQLEAPEWQRPSQLMCWLAAPRFCLDTEDLDLFGIDTLNRSLGGVYVGVNKAVGKHHWEVFQDEGQHSRVEQLTTTSLRSQTEAAGDFDIEWANDVGKYEWQQIRLQQFREWLVRNGFDPEDRNLTIGHPQIGQVDLAGSFGTDNYKTIWKALESHLDVRSVRTSDQSATYDYHWSDPDYMRQQIESMEKH